MQLSPFQLKLNSSYKKKSETGNGVEFLLEMCSEGQRLKGKKAFEELRQLLSEEDLKVIRESRKEFRENFKLR
jgi:hypothetical protein